MLIMRGERYYDTARPSQVAEATTQELKPLKITNRRAQVLINIANDICQRELDVEAFHDMPADEVYDRLCAIFCA